MFNNNYNNSGHFLYYIGIYIMKTKLYKISYIGLDAR